MHSILKNDYRCEYIYKNLILQELISRYSYSDTSIFSKFKEAGSIADLFFLMDQLEFMKLKQS